MNLFFFFQKLPKSLNPIAHLLSVITRYLENVCTKNCAIQGINSIFVTVEARFFAQAKQGLFEKMYVTDFIVALINKIY